MRQQPKRHRQMEEQVDRASAQSRRALLRMGLGMAASVPLSGWLAACDPEASHEVKREPTATATTAIPTATPDLRPITIAITGDVMLARSLSTQMAAGNDRFPFNYTADYLHSFDLTVGNLECVVSTLGSPIPGKEFTFEANPIGFESPARCRL